MAIGWLALFAQVPIDFRVGSHFLHWWGVNELTKFIGWSFLVTACVHSALLLARLSKAWPGRIFFEAVLGLHLLNALCCLPMLLNPWMWIAPLYLALGKCPMLLGLSLLLPEKRQDLVQGPDGCEIPSRVPEGRKSEGCASRGPAPRT